MKKNIKSGLISLSGALVLLCGVVGLRVNHNNNNDNESKMINPNDYIEEVVDNKISLETYIPHYYVDTVDVEESVNALGIVNNDSYPFYAYKFIRFIDYNHYEKIAIVNSYVDFIVDEDGNEIDAIYSYYDTFNGELLLTTHDKKRIESFDSNIVYHLTDYGDLFDLRDLMISKGLDRDYVYNIIKNNMKDKMLYKDEIGSIYVQLVNSSNRYEKSYQKILH